MNPSTYGKLTETSSLQVVAFRCGELLVGLELTDVQEINRIDTIAAVPEAPPHVGGVINLRGEVVTMIDLRIVLNQRTSDQDEADLHNVFVRSEGEVIGLITDGVSDIFAIRRNAIDVTPSNVNGAETAMIRGVHTRPSGELMVILDLPQVLMTNSELNQPVNC